jgi:hypothetical protein
MKAKIQSQGLIDSFHSHVCNHAFIHHDQNHVVSVPSSAPNQVKCRKNKWKVPGGNLETQQGDNRTSLLKDLAKKRFDQSGLGHIAKADDKTKEKHSYKLFLVWSQ